MTDEKRALHRIYWSMRSRCGNAKHEAFARYGGRGITVCQRWVESFDAFCEDMGSRPSARHSLDRIDNDKGYEPGNVRWATGRQQARNTSGNRRVTWKGETFCLTEWAERTGINVTTLRFRIAKGWPLDRVFTAPVRVKAPNGAGDQRQFYRRAGREVVS